MTLMMMIIVICLIYSLPSEKKGSFKDNHVDHDREDFYHHKDERMMISHSLASATTGVLERHTSLTFLLCMGREQDFR